MGKREKGRKREREIVCVRACVKKKSEEQGKKEDDVRKTARSKNNYN